MFRSNSFENSARAELDGPCRTQARGGANSGAGPSAGLKRRRSYVAMPRVMAASGWKATFMSV